MSIAAFLVETLLKIIKAPKCPSSGEQMNTVWFHYSRGGTEV